MKQSITSILFLATLFAVGSAYAGRFIDNGDGTVSDSKTSLTWQQRGDGHRYNWFVATGLNDQQFNPDGASACGHLHLAGHADWRLPTKDELLTIVDTSVKGPGPTINSTYFPATKSSVYWSASTNHQGAAYGVVFRDGNLFIGSKGYNQWYVRCVRGKGS